jgi:NADH-quinone oxidoreductase subunit N
MKRLLAYSSISHAGYLLVAVWAASPAGHMAVLLYLWAYSLTSLAAFGMVAAVEHVGARTVRIEDLEGLFRTRPWGALSMSVCLLSLLGFPGTVRVHREVAHHDGHAASTAKSCSRCSSVSAA